MTDVERTAADLERARAAFATMLVDPFVTDAQFAAAAEGVAATVDRQFVAAVAAMVRETDRAAAAAIVDLVATRAGILQHLTQLVAQRFGAAPERD